MAAFSNLVIVFWLQRGRACEGAEGYKGLGRLGRMAELQRGRACEGAEGRRLGDLGADLSGRFNGAAPVRARKEPQT